MRFLIVTRADDGIKEMTDLTHPIIKEFARRWDADFFMLNDNADCNDEEAKIYYRIMEIYDLLKIYDRVMNIDSDIIINKDCPNLFELVPNDKIGVIFEDKGSRQKDRRRRILNIQSAWGNIKWKVGYINIGIFLVSRFHGEIFKKFVGRYWESMGYADVHLGYQIHRLSLNIFELHWRFNHMSMFSEIWNGSPSRFDSHIIHYAGAGSFPDKGKRSKIQLIKDDVARIYG